MKTNTEAVTVQFDAGHEMVWIGGPTGARHRAAEALEDFEFEPSAVYDHILVDGDFEDVVETLDAAGITFRILPTD